MAVSMPMMAAANQLAPSSTAMAAPEVAKEAHPDRVEDQHRRVHPQQQMGERRGDRDGEQCDRDVGPMLDRIRRPVEQQIAQHTPAYPGENPQRRDAKQVEPFAYADSRARRGEYRNAEIVEDYLQHACTVGANLLGDGHRHRSRDDLVAALFTFAASIKLLGVPQSLAIRDHLGIKPVQWRLIGVCELAGVAGVLVGLVWAPIGIAAAIGLALLSIGAIAFHLRASDGAKDTAAP